jgi:phage regulator Rha-like protein
MNELMNIDTKVDDTLNMTHLQFAEITGKPEGNVRRTMESLKGKGLIHITQSEKYGEINGLGFRKKVKVFTVNERDSYIVMARLSPEFTAQLVDEWKAMKEEKTKQPPALPTMKELALMVIKVEEEKEALLVENKEIANVSNKKSLQNYTPTKLLAFMFKEEVVTPSSGLAACDINEALVSAGYQERHTFTRNSQTINSYSLTGKGVDFGVQSTSGVTNSCKWVYKIIKQEDFLEAIKEIVSGMYY